MMKLALFFAFIIASINSIAQQAPGEASGAVTRPPAKIRSKDPPEAPPRAPRLSDAELAELLQAQTTAIKSLSSKLDSLEERIVKIEKGRR